MPKIWEHAKNILDNEEMRRTFRLDTAQNHELNFFFSANVRHCNIAYIHAFFL